MWLSIHFVPCAWVRTRSDPSRNEILVTPPSFVDYEETQGITKSEQIRILIVFFWNEDRKSFTLFVRRNLIKCFCITNGDNLRNFLLCPFHFWSLDKKVNLTLIVVDENVLLPREGFDREFNRLDSCNGPGRYARLNFNLFPVTNPTVFWSLFQSFRTYGEDCSTGLVSMTLGCTSLPSSEWESLWPQNKTTIIIRSCSVIVQWREEVRSQ